MKTYSGLIKDLEPNQIFVFGSNTDGIHGAGTAKIAREKYGAIYGQARGLQGRSYALVTTYLYSKYKMPYSDLLYSIEEFYKFAESNPNLEFLVAYTLDGFNLSGYTSEEFAKAFATFSSPSNVVFEDKMYNRIEEIRGK